LNGLVNSFSALAAQSGGVQLAYGFVALLGPQGLMTKAVERFYPGFSEAFSLTDFWGVALVYLYFQIPLMTVLMLPAMAGLKKEWFYAATSLGATRNQYLKDIALPALWPSMLVSVLLLFANAFAAYATAYALAGGSLNLVPIVIGFLINGNVLLNPSLAAAMVTWMMLIIIVSMGLRMILSRRSNKWLSNEILACQLQRLTRPTTLRLLRGALSSCYFSFSLLVQPHASLASRGPSQGLHSV